MDPAQDLNTLRIYCFLSTTVLVIQLWETMSLFMDEKTGHGSRGNGGWFWMAIQVRLLLEKNIAISGKENTQIYFVHLFVTVMARIMNGC